MSFNIIFNFVNFPKLPLLLSFRDPTGFIKAPLTLGLETKSQVTKSKSSLTITRPVPSFVSRTEPVPLDEMPIVQPALRISLTMFPNGVGNNSTLPIRLFPSHHKSLITCEAFFRETMGDSG